MVQGQELAMSKRSTPPDVLTEALALREAGFTVLAVSQRLGVSTRTLQRHFATHGAKKGAVKGELLAKARADLMNHITSNDAIRAEVAQLIADNIAHARHLRTILLEASAHMKATSLPEAVLVARAAAAYATTIKTTSDAVRSILPLDRLSDDIAEDLPELVVRVISDSEAVEIAKKAAAGMGNEDEASDDHQDDEVVKEE
jgi:AcrR family transcriptional regulator